MTESKDVVKRLMEARIIAMLSQHGEIPEKEAMAKFYNSVTYKWFEDDSYGIVREGSDAIFCRVMNELDGELVL